MRKPIPAGTIFGLMCWAKRLGAHDTTPNASFPRRRESSTRSGNCWLAVMSAFCTVSSYVALLTCVYWIPAFAGMTVTGVLIAVSGTLRI